MEGQQLGRWETKRKDSFPRRSPDRTMVHSLPVNSGSVCIVTQQQRGEYRSVVISLTVIVPLYLFVPRVCDKTSKKVG